MKSPPLLTQIQSRCLSCGHQTVAPLAVYDTGKSVRRSVGWSSDYGCIGYVYDACTADWGCHLVAQEQEGAEEPSDSKYQQKLPLICLWHVCVIRHLCLCVPVSHGICGSCILIQIKTLHMGKWGGWLSKILYVLAAFIGGFLPVSGHYLWWKRKFGKKGKAEG